MTTRHIKQVASDPQAAQISHMKHQCTDLPSSKHKKKKSFMKCRSPSHKNDAGHRQQVSSYHNKKGFDAKNVYLIHMKQTKRDVRSIEIHFILKVSNVLQRIFNASLATSMDSFTSLYYQKKQASINPRKPKAHMLPVGAVYACDKSMCGNSENCSSSNESFCLQSKIQQSQAECKKILTLSYLITILAYKLNYIWQETNILGQDWTIVHVNIMSASVYKLVYKFKTVQNSAHNQVASWEIAWKMQETLETLFVG